MHPRDDHHLLIRRRIADGQLAFYRCHTPGGATLTELVRVAGARWAIEECFQAAKTETGLDEYQAAATTPGIGTSPWRCWPTPGSPPKAAAATDTGGDTTKKGTHHLWTTRRPRRDQTPNQRQKTETRVIKLTVNEIRRLWTALHPPRHSEQTILAWSQRRRQHQQRAKRCHYQRRLKQHHKVRLEY